jgi:hypothetical protein
MCVRMLLLSITSTYSWGFCFAVAAAHHTQKRFKKINGTHSKTDGLAPCVHGRAQGGLPTPNPRPAV